MSASVSSISALQSKIWSGSLALEIRLASSDCRTYDESEPYLIQFPRLSYLAFLLPRLHAFFSSSLINPEVSSFDAWLSFEDVPLKWHYPLGLLYDLFSGAEPAELEAAGQSDSVAASHATVEGSTGTPPIPWKLTIHYTDFPYDQLIQLDPEGLTMRDTFVNSVKEADYVRNGSARTVMSLSKEDSDNLWLSVQKRRINHLLNCKQPLTMVDDLLQFRSVNNKLLYPPGMELRHVPTKIYLPSSAQADDTSTIPEETKPGHMRVVQSLIPLQLPSRQAQTLGTALNTILPSIFPSRRILLYARPVLHGAAVPLAARMDDLGKAAANTDGFLHIAVVMHG